MSTRTSHAHPPEARVQHAELIEKIAEEANWPATVVAEIYWHELKRLQDRASIKAYVPLLAAKKVREALRRAPVRAKAA
jgi:hypothetical protein